MKVLVAVQLTGEETGCITFDIHHQWCRITPVGAPNRICSSSASYVAWWLWSSAIGPNIGSSEGEILSGYSEPRCYWVCHQLSLVPCCKGSLHRSTDTTGSLVASSPGDLLCIDFLKVDTSRDAKENILVLTDAFTKFSHAFVANNQKVLTVAKILVDKCFYIYGIPACIHSNKGWNFENAVISELYFMYKIRQSMTTPYNPHEIPSVKGWIIYC